jgi:NAD(P)-dependent dehydrogenase (short-subunit alcohol dehydrogenase family)
VLIVGRNAEKSASALRELQSRASHAESLACDVTDEAAVQALFAAGAGATGGSTSW